MHLLVANAEGRWQSELVMHERIVVVVVDDDVVVVCYNNNNIKNYSIVIV